MYAIVAGVSGNTRLQAKDKPEKLGPTSYQVTENKARIGTCTPSGSAPPFFICTCEHVTGLAANRCRSLARGFSWLPSPFPCMSHSAPLFFSSRRSLKRWLSLALRRQLRPEVYAPVHFWHWVSGTHLIMTQWQLIFDCGTGLRQLSYLRVENAQCSLNSYPRFVHAGINSNGG